MKCNTKLKDIDFTSTIVIIIRVRFWKQVNECNDSLKKKRDLRIEIPVSEMMYSENNRLLNYGYQFPESVYRLLYNYTDNCQLNCSNPQIHK